MKVLGWFFVLVLLVPSSADTNAITKVVELLRNLRDEVEKEGKDDAATYDKFACFCKDQASDKQWAIEQSEKKILRLDGEINATDAKIADLNQQIEASWTVVNDTTEWRDSNKSDQKDLDRDYHQRDKARMVDIKLVEKAMKSLEESKGKVEAGASLLELAKVHGRADLVNSLQNPSHTGEGSGAQYSYSSDHVMTALRKFLRILQSMKKSADEAWREEHDRLEILWRGHEKSRELAQKEKEYDEKTKAEQVLHKSKLEEERSLETRDKGYDENFINELKQECSAEATAWDNRSTDRNAELKALAGALDALTDERPGSNRDKVEKLYGSSHQALLQNKGRKHQAKPSFLQKRAVSTEETNMALLNHAVSKLKNENLGALRLKITMMGKEGTADHFVKVREIIQTLVNKLIEELNQSDSDASDCISATNDARQEKSTASGEMQTQQAVILEANREVKENEAEVKRLASESTEIAKEQEQRDVLREEQKTENDAQLQKMVEGEAAVQEAIDILECHYNNVNCPTGFLQKSSEEPGSAEPFRASNADRSGNTVGDLAPETMEYEQKDDPAKAILALLETVKSDFATSAGEIRSDEGAAQQEYDDETGENEARQSDIKSETSQAETDIGDAKEDRSDAEDTRSTAESDFKAAEANLADAPCPKQESWDDRSKARQMEIAQLKEALQILEERDGITNVR